MSENELWEQSSELFPPFLDVVKLVPVQTLSVLVFAVIMANAPVGFPLHQMQEGLDQREHLDCFILDYIDYCTVMGWFERKDGCQYDDQSEDGKNQWKKQNLCMSTLRATLPSKIKRLINPNNKTLGLSEEDKSYPVEVIQALVKRFGGSVSVQAERMKMGRVFQDRKSVV